MHEERLAQLETRLAVAEARLAILDLEGEYARSWDAADAEGWAAVFTTDGVFDMAGVGWQPRRVYTGRTELAQFCRDINASYRGLHLPNLPRIIVEGDTARSRVHFQWLGLFATSTPPHSGQRHAAGYYDVTYRRVDGQWLMQHRLEKAVTGATYEAYDGYLSPDIR
jgi:hypothetical protein